jgi:Flp pilus assembly pilin Flp
MKIKRFLQEDQGAIATEYVIFVAAIGIVLAVGVFALTGAMRDLFTAWKQYFEPGG